MADTSDAAAERLGPELGVDGAEHEAPVVEPVEGGELAAVTGRGLHAHK
jgi:hypothetical protein